MALKRSNEAERTETEATAEVEETGAEARQEDSAGVLDDAQPEERLEEAVATRDSGSQIAAPRRDAVGILAAAGFEGLHIDWTSFPTIVLNGTQFETSDGNPLGVDEFHARLQQSRKRYVYRTSVAVDDDAELAYTYDPSELDNSDSELAKKVEQWKSDGLDFAVKEYIEAVAVIEDEDCNLNGQMVLLQIPPTSTGRFSGFLTANAMSKGKAPQEYLTRFHRGEKVMKAKKPFTPWAFSYAG